MKQWLSSVIVSCEDKYFLFINWVTIIVHRRCGGLHQVKYPLGTHLFQELKQSVVKAEGLFFLSETTFLWSPEEHFILLSLLK